MNHPIPPAHMQQREVSMLTEPIRSMKPHFLIVTYPAQGHLNPSRQLARRLARATGAAVTLSTAISGQRRMFPSGAAADGGVDGGLISYVPFSDGYDDGFDHKTGNPTEYMSHSRAHGYKSLSAVIRSLADQGRPVTCVIYALLLTWVADVARDLRIPSALYWIQPATVFATYYHYYHGYRDVVAAARGDPSAHVQLPGLPLLRVGDLPSFLSRDSKPNADADINSVVADLFQEMFDMLDMDAETKILVNTFDDLERDALSSINKFEFYPIGPMVPFLDSSTGDAAADVDVGGADLFKTDEKGYMDWLDSKPVSSVVYVSFGSISMMKKKQLEEMQWGLKESGRPYLWVVRKDNRDEGVELEEVCENGMVVEWCDQVRVLSHPSVGCFVTHCGWNSTTESLCCGVSTVCAPQWTDQGTNARLMVEWGMGVRAELDVEGVLEGKELLRCLETVMPGGERGDEIRNKATTWMNKARKAVGGGGSSDRNLRAFVDGVACSS